jgi:hypothetical protein
LQALARGISEQNVEKFKSLLPILSVIINESLIDQEEIALSLIKFVARYTLNYDRAIELVLDNMVLT